MPRGTQSNPWNGWLTRGKCRHPLHPNMRKSSPLGGTALCFQLVARISVCITQYLVLDVLLETTAQHPNKDKGAMSRSTLPDYGGDGPRAVCLLFSHLISWCWTLWFVKPRWHIVAWSWPYSDQYHASAWVISEAMKQRCLRSLRTHCHRIGAQTNSSMRHQQNIDLVHNQRWSWYYFAGLLLQACRQQPLASAPSVSPCTDHNIQPGPWTNR